MKKEITGLLVGILFIVASFFAITERKEPQTIKKETFSPPKKTKIIIVKNGESLSVIASRIPGVSWQYLAELNNLENPSLIKPGQKLKIPAK